MSDPTRFTAEISDRIDALLSDYLLAHRFVLGIVAPVWRVSGALAVNGAALLGRPPEPLALLISPLS